MSVNFTFVDDIPSFDTKDVFFVQVNGGIKETEYLINSLYYLLMFPGYFGFNWNGV